MRRSTASLSLFAGLIATVLVGLDATMAQPFPNRPIRLIVPFAPGGLNDTVARLMQPHLEKGLRQPVVIDNRPAASGIVGTDAVAKAQPDGHTLLMVASSHTVVPATNARLPYDADRDFAAVAMIGRNPLLFVVNAKTSAKTLGEFVTLARENPGKINYATPGAASQSHLVTELFSQRAGIKLQHIPYRGGAPAILAMVSGETGFAVISPLASLPHIQSGTLRAIASGSLTRDPQMSDVPTVDEAGFPGFEAIQWVGLLTTAGTPSEIVSRLNTEVNRAIRDPDVIARLAAQGAAPAGGTSGEFQAVIANDIRNWTDIARSANIKAE
jgi:tripartite-type tricarboxylate transporter receptor subunit TctC